jgi:aminopeptidase YwaD
MTEEEGERLVRDLGKTVALTSVSKRIPGKANNIIARKGKQGGRRIVVTAHIDTKKGTPGAIDNATGVVVMLLLADLLKEYSGNMQIEVVALNGEDHYAAPGQMRYLHDNKDCFQEILLNINIDGAGYKEGNSAFSFYNLPQDIEKSAKTTVHDFGGITEGVKWPQGDHSIFIQHGCPAIAVSSQWFTENIDAQEITHTSRDSLDIVDCSKVVEIACALDRFLRLLEGRNEA